jgi:hypothetical protein
MPVILVNRESDPKRVIGKNGGPRKRRGTWGTYVPAAVMPAIIKMCPKLSWRRSLEKRIWDQGKDDLLQQTFLHLDTHLCNGADIFYLPRRPLKAVLV